ncbi:BadF/BadG/BcrA/BcrD ATPase family protein [Chromobacterium sp. IIBBL 290-4]|uniref:BadF/BadG/BcrA/BcrD ATPase family protein n=1 Tax=Chromobacterium sp. IIBBL 290-4 TaxID=2953890 RepID=UPI0020B86D9B|nr:BadF/BadG/BcrA/BcrD ATPase family protein [Chromobacterium sp. IIBBL 290-4]UTH73671.1 ATPase [Chromobacterium sp. IIBBL 290-4]
MQNPKYLIGVDGGGTGTRVIVAAPDLAPVAHAEGPGSSLAIGTEQSWQVIRQVTAEAFRQARIPRPEDGQCAIGLGLAGVHNKVWAQQFLNAAPAYAAVKLATDGYTTLLGAHDGQPGVIVALGTGSIGEALYPDGSHREVGGWGYPSGDEASGAWLGQRAAQLTQMALDGRRSHSPLSRAVLHDVGGSWQEMMNWHSQATPARFAQLAPLVLEAARKDPEADALLRQAGEDAWAIARALDPEETLPVALCGGLGKALQDWLPPGFRRRLVTPLGDSTQGALLLLKR